MRNEESYGTRFYVDPKVREQQIRKMDLANENIAALEMIKCQMTADIAVALVNKCNYYPPNPEDIANITSSIVDLCFDGIEDKKEKRGREGGYRVQ